MDEYMMAPIVVTILFIGLPWLIFHYITRWKTAATISGSDEKLLDELHDLARRLDERMCSIERIMTAENPNWRQQCSPEQPRLPVEERSVEEELARLQARSRAREVR